MVLGASRLAHWSLTVAALLVAASGCGGDDSKPPPSPQSVAAGQASPGPIAADGDGVYWVNVDTRDVMSLPHGAGAPVRLGEASAPAADLAVDPERVHWATAGDDASIEWVVKHGGDVVRLTSGQGRVTGVALDETCVFWASATDGAVRTMWKDGGNVADVAANEPNPVGVARAPSGIFWLAGEDEARVRRVKQLGDPAADEAEIAGMPAQIAVRDADVYFSVAAAGKTEIWHASADGGDAGLLASGSAPPVALALGAADLYWADAAGGIWRAPLGGGAAERLVQLDRAPVDLAFASDTLYWTDPGAGANNGGVWSLSTRSTP